MTNPTRPTDTGEFPVRPVGTYVYRAFGYRGELLYVGVTDELCTRLAAHRAASGWWMHCARVTWEEWPNRYRALLAETKAIGRERPIWNIQGNFSAAS